MTLGEKIIELRKKEKLTQEKLSDKLGISRQTLSNWESGNTCPDIEQAKAIAKLFKISLDDLTDNQLDVELKQDNNVLVNLINKECYLDVDSNDYYLNYTTKCKIIDVNNGFIKVEYQKGKKTVTKLIDLTLISSFKVIEEDGDK